MKIGKTSFNLAEVAKLNKADFKKRFKGKLDTDIDQTYEALKKAIKNK
jgi:hypothetical protein